VSDKLLAEERKKKNNNNKWSKHNHCHGNGQNAKKIEKHKNDHSRLLADQKLM
jgi:hypothetical protein